MQGERGEGRWVGVCEGRGLEQGNDGHCVCAGGRGEGGTKCVCVCGGGGWAGGRGLKQSIKGPPGMGDYGVRKQATTVPFDYGALAYSSNAMLWYSWYQSSGAA
jgi:hypothetical protein